MKSLGAGRLAGGGTDFLASGGDFLASGGDFLASGGDFLAFKGGGANLGGSLPTLGMGGLTCRADAPPPQPLTVTCSSMLPAAQSSPAPELR